MNAFQIFLPTWWEDIREENVEVQLGPGKVYFGRAKKLYQVSVIDVYDNKRRDEARLLTIEDALGEVVLPVQDITSIKRKGT